MTTLARFSPATRAWFEGAFEGPTPAQEGAWEAIAAGQDALVVAPTGSGKTLSAFLWSLDRLASTPTPEHRCRVLYISPLKALAVDVERNLRAPLTGIRQAAQRLGLAEPDVRVALRSGDTPAADRRAFTRTPPDILITTPESLFLLLTSAAREALRGVETVIVDEVHAVAGTKRGAHLALSLERLDALLAAPAQRVGLSATVRPVEEVARFLGGARPVTVVQPPSAKTIEVSVVVPVDDLAELGDADRQSIWPAVEERVVDLVQAHRSTIVFCNSRRSAERLTSRLNEIATERATGVEVATYPAQHPAQGGVSRAAWGNLTPRDGLVELARAHHGSVSREQRSEIEEALKAGRLPCVVATSSLELGIDMGAVDLVIQVESPPSVASGLQRVGRAGHQVGAVSRGVVLPKFRGDLLQSAVVAQRMVAGQIEALSVPRNPLDVLAQQIVAMCALEDWTVDDLLTVVRRAAPFSTLTRPVLDAVLDMLSGRYPSDEFAELRPRLTWDRLTGVLTGRPGAQRLAVTSGGTIPDRGLFGVFLVGEKGSRVGELDEEMVYESRVGDVFLLGSSAWRIEDISHDRVLVTPAPGQPGRMPYWHGDQLGRPLELGRALGAFVRALGKATPEEGLAQLQGAGLDDSAARNLLAYLAEQRVATGVVPDDHTIVVERFRDELGDWRLAIHSPFGAQVNQPWSLALAARMREGHGLDVQAMHSDDGIVLRLPDADEPPPSAVAVFEPDEVEARVRDEVGGSALFAARFRECAARALLLPRRNPGRRTPLWQQRQRAAQLLGVASEYGSFPIVLETMREVLQDVFDVPGLIELMRDVQQRTVRVVEVETARPSPFAQQLLFGYVGQFMYEGDSPLAERRAQALSLDSALLAELLGQAELRELLDPDALADVEAELQRLAPDRHARDAEGAADLLRLLGALTTEEAALRGAAAEWLVSLEQARRVIRVRIAGEERWAAIEDAGRLRDALGTALPVGVPEVFTEPVNDPLGDLVSRYARTHGPFHAADAAARLGLGPAVVETALSRLATSGRVVRGAFRPAGNDTEWCDAEVLRSLRRRSLARLRKEVEPVAPEVLARFLPAWHGLTSPARGADAVLRAVEQLQGVPLPASTLETLVLPARVADYSPALLDELTASGEVLWAGCGSLPGNDGWLTLVTADRADLLLASPVEAATPLQSALLEALEGGQALFFRALVERCEHATEHATEHDVQAALWELAWAGWVTNDTLAPLRALLAGSTRRRTTPTRPGRRVLPSRLGPPTVSGRWSRLPAPSLDPTLRGHALAETLLERHGVVTRGAVQAERTPGGFAASYAVLKAFEEAGRVRRGYFVEGLGGAQFASPGAVDRMRAMSRPREQTPLWTTPVPGGWRGHGTEAPRAVVLAAADPANAYGSALAWPDAAESAGGHRPGRKAGAVVVLVDGALVLYVEKGGRSLLSFSDDPDLVGPAATALADTVRAGALGRLTVERTDGESSLRTALGEALEKAGFIPTPRGLRLRG